MKKLASVQDYLAAGHEKVAVGWLAGEGAMKGVGGAVGKNVGEMIVNPWVMGGLAGAAAIAELAPWVADKIKHMQLAREHEKMVVQLRRGDDMLGSADLGELTSAYSSMAKFAPTLAADPNAARSFLRNAVASGGGVDFNTLKLLAETENEATGRYAKK